MAPRRFFASAQKPSQPRDERPLLTTEQVRVRLGLPSIWAVYRLVRGHGLPRLTVGGLYRFEPAALDRWIEMQREDEAAAVLRVVGSR